MSREAAPRPRQNLEEVAKPAATILRKEISSGTTQLERPTTGCFCPRCPQASTWTSVRRSWPRVRAATDGDGLAVRVWLAAAYSIGFMIVVFGRSELFTEHATLAILPFLSRQTTHRKIGRLWALVYAGNLVGGAAFAALVGTVGLHLGLFSAADIDTIASRLLSVDAPTMLAAAIVAGWIVGLVSWLVTAARDTINQVIFIILLTGAVAFLRLHHCIAGAIEILLAVFYGHAAVGGWLRFMAVATLGNVLGGAIFVALVKFGHVRFAGLSFRAAGSEARPWNSPGARRVRRACVWAPHHVNTSAPAARP